MAIKAKGFGVSLRALAVLCSLVLLGCASAINLSTKNADEKMKKIDAIIIHALTRTRLAGKDLLEYGYKNKTMTVVNGTRFYCDSYVETRYQEFKRAMATGKFDAKKMYDIFLMFTHSVQQLDEFVMRELGKHGLTLSEEDLEKYMDHIRTVGILDQIDMDLKACQSKLQKMEDEVRQAGLKYDSMRIQKDLSMKKVCRNMLAQLIKELSKDKPLPLSKINFTVTDPNFSFRRDCVHELFDVTVLEVLKDGIVVSAGGKKKLQAESGKNEVWFVQTMPENRFRVGAVVNLYTETTGKYFTPPKSSRKLQVFKEVDISDYPFLLISLD